MGSLSLRRRRRVAKQPFAHTVIQSRERSRLILTVSLRSSFILRWLLFDIGSGLHFMYQGIFDTEFDKYTEDAVALFMSLGVNTVFENLEGFPMDWKTNAPAFVNFVREHQHPSFLEYGEYPYVTADEIKKALRVKSSLSMMLDQMQ
jgi:hypothetical protein